MSIIDRVKKGWNAFMGREPPLEDPIGYGYATTLRPDTNRLSFGVDRTIVSAIYNRIAMDVATVDIRHVYVDKNENFKSANHDTYLSDVLKREANLDQTGREFIQDLVLSLFDEGVVAAVPIDTIGDPRIGPFDIKSIRTGKILQWYPKHVKLRVYNENDGKFHEITLPKRAVAIITNPLYAVMNQPNSTLQRLIRKLTLLDVIDEQTGSGKLNVIIQLPYMVKTESRKAHAEKLKTDLETQLAESKYGVAYTDGNERIIQLNRPLENNLLSQIEYLTNLLYSQLGLSQSIFDCTADEKTMLNYNNRTVMPILTAITEEMNRKFLTKTAYTQGQRITFSNKPFKLVPVAQLADIVDKFTRAEAMSSNEFRALIGYAPVDDEKANELRNSNLNRGANDEAPAVVTDDEDKNATDSSNTDDISKKVEALLKNQNSKGGASK